MKPKNRLIITVLTIIVLMIATSTSGSAKSLDPRVKAVILTSAYGTIGGAVVGLATTAFGGDENNIFIGASLGLYAGIGIGLFLIFNPRRPKVHETSPDDYDRYEDEGAMQGAFLNVSPKRKIAFAMPEVVFTPDLKNGQATLLKVRF